MRTPISYAMAWPDRLDWGAEPLDLAAISALTFEAVDPERFPCFILAREALEAGGVAPAVLNAANEVAVECVFARQDCFLTGLQRSLRQRLQQELDGDLATIDAVFDVDQSARQQAHDLVAKGSVFKKWKNWAKLRMLNTIGPLFYLFCNGFFMPELGFV